MNADTTKKRVTDLKPGDIVFVKRKEEHKKHVKAVFLEIVSGQYIAVFLFSQNQRVEVPILWLKDIQVDLNELIQSPPTDKG
ncbi:MAG: hypothetical protein ACYS1A_18755 [Planctomycetota bacterium]|jgi:hypothetical protein